MHWRDKVYALYKGDNFIAEGTIEEIAKETNKTEQFVRYMTFPSYEAKSDGPKRMRMISLEEEDDLDEEIRDLCEVC